MKQQQSWMREPAKAFRMFLVVVLALRIVSYFMLSDSLWMVQAIKSGLRIFLTVTLLVAIFLESRREHRFGDTIKHPMPIWLYAIYLIFGAASLLWTSSFSDSVLQWLMDAEGFVFAWLFIHLLGMYRHRHPGGYFDLHKVIAPAVLLNGVGFLIGMYVDPDKFYRLTHGGAVSRLGGFIINPNELGMLLVIGVSCFLPLIVKEGKIRISIILYLLMLIQMLLLTGSRSSFIALVAVLMVYALHTGSKTQRTFMAASALALVPLAGWSFFVKQDQLQELFTFTGRLPFWKDLLTYNFPREPWLGYGYMRIDYADKFESLNAYAGAMTHNTFMQVLLGLGLVGLSIVLLQLTVFLWTLRRVADKKYRLTVWLILIPLLVNSLTEFGIFGETNYGILFYLFLVFTASSETLSDSRRIRGATNHEKPNGISYRPAHLT
jgi:exopolysaccharide production protein ExoQ